MFKNSGAVLLDTFQRRGHFDLEQLLAKAEQIESRDPRPSRPARRAGRGGAGRGAGGGARRAAAARPAQPRPLRAAAQWRRADRPCRRGALPLAASRRAATPATQASIRRGGDRNARHRNDDEGIDLENRRRPGPIGDGSSSPHRSGRPRHRAQGHRAVHAAQLDRSRCRGRRCRRLRSPRDRGAIAVEYGRWTERQMPDHVPDGSGRTAEARHRLASARARLGAAPANWPSFPPEQFLDVAMGELHPGRAAVVALAAVRGDLHLAEQRVHLGDREQPAGADRAVAGHGRGDMVELFLEAERANRRRRARRRGRRPGP